jgi:hypothetical protein
MNIQDIHDFIKNSEPYAWWATVLAEIGVMIAILLEVRNSRRTSFLGAVFGSDNAFYKARGDLYQRFIEKRENWNEKPGREKLWRRSLAFSHQAFDDPKLRAECDTQITHLNQTARLCGRSLIFRRRDPALLSWFPHTAVLCWIMLAPYILKRRDLVGSYWAAPLNSYALEAVRFILRDKEAQLVLWADTPKNAIVIQRQVLESVRSELQAAVKMPSRVWRPGVSRGR